MAQFADTYQSSTRTRTFSVDSQCIKFNGNPLTGLELKTHGLTDLTSLLHVHCLHFAQRRTDSPYLKNVHIQNISCQVLQNMSRTGRSQSPRGLRRGSFTSQTLRPWVRIPWMYICSFCVLSCVDRRLSTGRIPVQGVLSNVK
jgi:hypothetical protein